VQVEAFLPFVLWSFVAEFPRITTFGRSEGVQRAASTVTFTVGAALLLLNLTYGAALLSGWTWTAPTLASAFARYDGRGFFHTTLFILMLPMFPFLVWKGRLARAEERRRAWLLLAGIVWGTMPMLVTVLIMAFSSRARAFLFQPEVFRWVELAVYAGTLSVPVTTAYAVLVQHMCAWYCVGRSSTGWPGTPSWRWRSRRSRCWP
jgi:hypothetical protein